VIDVSAVQLAFPELSNVAELPVSSGQKFVLAATREGKRVALKLFKRGLADLARTQREIRAVSKLNSKYVPTIFDSGTRKILGDEVLFIIEEFVEGSSYRDRLIAQPIQDCRSVLRILFHLLLACCDFEREKIVHRDIKPENLILDPAQKLWIIDFGFARHLDLKSLTGDSPYGGVGTLGYAAPEQFQNIKAEINIRTDLFAVGTVVLQASCR
jgi:serine/threonine protein kinase